MRKYRTVITAPRNVNKEFWYYEEPKGLCVVSHGNIDYIPWGMIMRSVARFKHVKFVPVKPARKKKHDS